MMYFWITVSEQKIEQNPETGKKNNQATIAHT